MFCKYCGATLDDDSVFCTKCGKRLDNKTSATVEDVNTNDIMLSKSSSNDNVQATSDTEHNQDKTPFHTDSYYKPNDNGSTAFKLFCIVGAILSIIQIYFWYNVNSLTSGYKTRLISELFSMKIEWFLTSIVICCIISSSFSFLAACTNNHYILTVPTLYSFIMIFVTWQAPSIYSEVFDAPILSITGGTWLSVVIYAITSVLLFLCCIGAFPKKATV